MAECESPIENPVENHPLQRFGAYRVTGTLGHGGMGVVYRAIRDDGAFDKLVAIKLLRVGMETPSAMDSFRRERKTLAGLEHRISRACLMAAKPAAYPTSCSNTWKANRTRITARDESLVAKIASACFCECAAPLNTPIVTLSCIAI